LVRTSRAIAAGLYERMHCLPLVNTDVILSKVADHADMGLVDRPAPMSDRSWLCPTEQDRARVVENSDRVRRARRVASAAIGLTLVYGIPHYGWWLLGLLVVSVVNTETLDRRMAGSPRPEAHVAFSIFWSQCIVAVAAALTGGPKSPLLPMIAVPTAFAAARFRRQVAEAATGIAIVLVLVAGFAAHPAQSLAHPAGPLVDIAVVVGVSAATRAISMAEQHMRNAAILDPLTGLLTRQGLERRFEELAEQARLAGAPISLLICDLDHFKDVNDSRGHAVGDAVLRDVAYELRQQLRSFELIYRYGGEEFLVVLPGATLEDATAIAERLCDAVRHCSSNQLPMTMSVGVSTRWGGNARYEALFEAADRALYQAKAEGRDRVVATVHDRPVQLGTAGSTRAATATAGC
jgi:diguanylate cyclase (GGDEF)-like protein